MTRLPRDVSGQDLVQALKNLEYSPTRQSGSHIRLTTYLCGEHHVTIPNHASLRVGTFSSILNEVSAHFKMSRDDLLKKIF